MAYVAPYTPLAQRKKLRDALQRWAETQALASTHFVTLATHQQMPLETTRRYLRRWDAHMNRQIVGSRWRKKQDIHCLWIAFPEGNKSDPHWHLLFGLSPDLPHHKVEQLQDRLFASNLTDALGGAARTSWNKVVRSGTADVRLIGNREGLSRYVTKEQTDEALYNGFMTSLELKTS